MKYALTLTLCLAATGAQAEFITGNTLLAEMNGTVMEQISAQSYVTGAADAIAGAFWCPNKYVTVKQAHDITKKWLEDMPQHRDNSASAFVRAALGQAFPCKSVAKGAL